MMSPARSPSKALLGPFVSEGVLNRVGWGGSPLPTCGCGGWPMTHGAPAPEAWGSRTLDLIQTPWTCPLQCEREEPCMPGGN